MEMQIVCQPFELANILFFEMPHRVIDSEGRRDITITGGGNAYVFQAGTMREVKWKNVDGLDCHLRRRGVCHRIENLARTEVRNKGGNPACGIS